MTLLFIGVRTLTRSEVALENPKRNSFEKFLQLSLEFWTSGLPVQWAGWPAMILYNGSVDVHLLRVDVR